MRPLFYMLQLGFALFLLAVELPVSQTRMLQHHDSRRLTRRHATCNCDDAPQFSCTSGEGIDATKICNGAKDCEDSSDENECEDFTCPNSHFRCKYGACVEMSAVCNGVKDCLDGSDENRPQCTKVKSIEVNKAGRPGLGCTIPPHSAGRILVVSKNDVVLNVTADRIVPRYSNVKVQCRPGYTLINRLKSDRSICDMGQWLPALKACIKICPRLHPTNAYLTCQRFGLDIDCGDDLVSGTVVRARCKEYHTEEKEVDYGKITCTENGEWDNPLFKCVLACGSPYTVSTLIAKGERSIPGDTPWHVAIYRLPLNHLLICGGTLISRRIVLSAAHCFYDDGLGKSLNNTAEYEVVVGKYTRDYHKTDNSLQKRHKIKELIFNDRGYNPDLSGHHGGDIIIIVLEQPVTIGMYVLPVCVSWNSDLGFNPGEGAKGRLAGWGVDDISPDVGAETLITAELPYISYSACAGQLQHITLDKFCAGSATGAGARKGDSGGGLVFRNFNNNRYYIRGIVSTADKESNSSVATFTDVSYYLSWIKEVRERVERESSKLPNNARQG